MYNLHVGVQQFMRQKRFFRHILLALVSASLLLIYTTNAQYPWSPNASRGPVVYAAGATSATGAANTIVDRAFVIGSDPVDGSTIATPPRIVRIFFNADISSASFAHVYVF